MSAELEMQTFMIVAPVGIGMHPEMRAEMAQEFHQEMDRMKEDQQDPGFTHDVVAVDSEGSVVFETESLYPNELDGALDDYPEGDAAPEGVDHYMIQER